MHVEVTESAITLGERGSAERCPIAWALHNWGCVEIFVGEDTLRFSTTDRRIELDVPPALREIITRYDDTGQMEPFSFDLDV